MPFYIPPIAEALQAQHALPFEIDGCQYAWDTEGDQGGFQLGAALRTVACWQPAGLARRWV